MKTTAHITDAGLLIPKHWLQGIDEVEIRKQRDVILVVPVRHDDPILELGREPVTADVTDASVNHDSYL